MMDARLTTGWRGCALVGRDSRPLDSFFVFQIGLTFFLTIRPCSVALPLTADRLRFARDQDTQAYEMRFSESDQLPWKIFVKKWTFRYGLLQFDVPLFQTL